jgi:plastocyanin
MTGLAACGPSVPAGPVSTDHVALPPSYLFKPTAIAVAPGTKVTWTNSDRFTHSVRLLDDGGQVMIMKPGDSTSFTFTTPATHHYDCSFHPHDMHGTVLVIAAH